MKLLLPAAALALAAILAALVFALPDSPSVAASGEPDSALLAELESLRDRVASLETRLAARAAPSAAPMTERAAAAPASQPGASVARLDRDAAWYLEQYVASFGDGERGSELYRIHVDAQVLELADPISTLIRESWRPHGLRLGLVQMLHRPRLAAHTVVLEALAAVALDDATSSELALAALDSLAGIRSAASVQGLVDLAVRTAHPERANKSIEVLDRIVERGWNGVLLSILRRAQDLPLRASLFPWLEREDPIGARALLELGSEDEQVVRLAAAQALQPLPFEEFAAFVREWRAREQDPAVAKLLDRFLGEGPMPDWHAMQATGAPDVEDPHGDSRLAWAAQAQDVGIEWLELDYARPARASGLRIHEVNSSGAVCEVRVRSGESWISVWKGTTASQLGTPLAIAWQPLSTDVRTVRILLDTARAKSWDEIDAVELLSDSGGQWAVRARASSIWGYSQEEMEPKAERSLRTRGRN